MGSAISGWGSALPALEVTSAELEARFGLPSGWVEERTGISARRVAGPEDTTTSLATSAGLRAIECAGISPGEVDMIMVATFTPDRALPPTAAVVQAELGATNAGAVDLGAACTGFLSGLSLAHALITAGEARRVLICGAETMSRSVRDSDPRTAVLFGDGAGAVIVEEIPGAPGLGPFRFGSDGSRPELLWADIDDRQVRMQGKAVYLRAVKEMAASVDSLLTQTGTSIDDIDLMVAHQANGRILSAVAEKLALKPERAYSNIARFGNTSGASIPLALCDAVAEEELMAGDRIVLTAFGSGFLWGSALLEWGSSPSSRPREESVATHV